MKELAFDLKKMVQINSYFYFASNGYILCFIQVFSAHILHQHSFTFFPNAVSDGLLSESGLVEIQFNSFLTPKIISFHTKRKPCFGCF